MYKISITNTNKRTLCKEEEEITLTTFLASFVQKQASSCKCFYPYLQMYNMAAHPPKIFTCIDLFIDLKNRDLQCIK